MGTGIYIASKAKHGPYWQSLRALGAPIISTWIDESGEGQTSDWPGLWDRCIAEASGAAALVMYVEPGEVHKGSLVEVAPPSPRACRSSGSGPRWGRCGAIGS